MAMAAMEWACCARAWAVVFATWAGVVPWYQVFLLYSLGIMSLGLNYVRNLVAHHYESKGEPISHVEQLVAKQQKRIASLQQEVESEMPIPDSSKKKE